ncbi:MAG: inosine monophosphate cyclohydrolase [Eubacteriales Family XIII. Incertae Sedis bacterium]|nr:MAG: inosine monophosphate cyclohydrolase [Clostridiales Family XIII bacterium]
MSVYKTENIGTVLAGNSYGGRGIVIGKSGDGKNAVIAYFIMGRSENSRNRVFIERGDEVVINAYDPSKLADPTLIIYSPVKVSGCHTIVTNGDQTDTIYDFITEGKSFEEALETRQFEPDAPNLTPRISGMLTVARRDFKYKLSILKSGTEDGAVCNRYTFSYAPVAGLGHYIHTYNCDGDPIPTFTGEPERVQIPDDIDEFTGEIWTNLDEDNKVALYVRYIDLVSGKFASRIVNKNK